MSFTDNGAITKSSYLKYLPAIYRDDKLMGGFLSIFESILKPIERTVDNLALYLDPQITPEHLLPWLASWMGLSLDPTWPEDSRRELVKSAAELYRWRGTKRGLTNFLRIYSGSEPEIYEYIPGMQLSGDTQLGTDTRLGSGGEYHHFRVVLTVDRNREIDESKVRAIIETQRPAHSTYALQIIFRDSGVSDIGS